MIFITYKTRGFTIIETFIAVTLFTLAIAASLSLVAKNIFFANTSKDRVVAIFLAQESLEFIENARTTNLLSSKPWLQDLDDCITTAEDNKSCRIETTSNANLASRVFPCNPSNPDTDSCPVLYYNTASYLYGYDTSNGTWEATPFSRRITLFKEPSNSDEVLVTVKVFWKQKNIVQSVTLEDRLFNWR